MSKVTCITIAYNAENTIRQTVESVLSQSYKDFTYVLVDHGSTDGTRQVIQEYERADTRIRGIYKEENCGSGSVLYLLIEQAKHTCSKWLAMLDADDWWESNYLERLLLFQEKNCLDIALTGTIADFEETGAKRILRKLEQPIVLTKRQFAQNYPHFWIYPSTVWGHLLRTDLFSSLDGRNLDGASGDTRLMLQYLDKCQRIGIDNSALYHYRVWSSMSSNRYEPEGFNGNIAFYVAACDFLKKNQTHGLTPIQAQWLKVVHLTSLQRELVLLHQSPLTHQEKLVECRRMITHPLTASALVYRCEVQEQCFETIRILVNSSLSSGESLHIEDVKAILTKISPDCALAVTEDTLTIFQKEPTIRRALLCNDRDGMVRALLETLPQMRAPQKYDVGGLMKRLALDNSLLFSIDDLSFLKAYPDIYQMVWDRENMHALDQMTGMLLENQMIRGEETFLNLYINLAALENQAPAFLFGKTRLARYYLKQGDNSACRKILQELDEMGMGKREDIAQLKAVLGEMEEKAWGNS